MLHVLSGGLALGSVIAGFSPYRAPAAERAHDALPLAHRGASMEARHRKSYLLETAVDAFSMVMGVAGFLLIIGVLSTP